MIKYSEITDDILYIYYIQYYYRDKCEIVLTLVSYLQRAKNLSIYLFIYEKVVENRLNETELYFSRFFINYD